MSGLQLLVVVICAVVVGLPLLGVWGTRRWRRATARLVDRLEASRARIGAPRYHGARELPGLPPPVQRYFRAVLREGQPLIAAATVEHRGEFNLGARRALWRPFRSWQRVVLRRPGFVWDGVVAAAPGLPVRVHDAYVAGEGLLRPALLGLVPLTELRSRSPEPGGVAHGELMRFLAEAAWYPTALLPSQGVRWSAVDGMDGRDGIEAASQARATLQDGEVEVTLTFRFAADGTIDSVYSPARGRTAKGTVQLTPWEGRWSDWQRHDGVRVPHAGEVAWITPQGRQPYWRGRIGMLRYEFAR